MAEEASTYSIWEVLELVLAVFIIVIVLWPIGGKIYKAIFPGDQKYIDSFNDFADGLQEFWDSGVDGTLLSVKLKEGSAIFGFAKGAENLQRIELVGGLPFGLQAKKERASLYSIKPLECQALACVCLCSGHYVVFSGEINCGKLLCRNLKGINFLDGKEAELVDRENLEKFTGDALLSGGFALYREKGVLVGQPGGLLALRDFGEEIAIVFVENIEGKIKVCNIKGSGCYETMASGGGETSSELTGGFKGGAGGESEGGIKNVVGTSDIKRYVEDTARKYGLDTNLIYAIIRVESNFNVNAINEESGAKGLMQLTNIAIRDLREGESAEHCKRLVVKNPFDPQENIMGGSCYFSYLLNKYSGNVNIALYAYNWGPGNVDACKREAACKVPLETRLYAKNVLNYAKEGFA